MKISKDINGTIGGCNNKKEGKFVTCLRESVYGFIFLWVYLLLSYLPLVLRYCSWGGCCFEDG